MRWAAWMAGVCAIEVVWMLYASRAGKLAQREKILDALNLRGEEKVLDIGCGRGLLLIGAARRLTSGTATGVDLWSNKDLSQNSMDATLANARLEGVADRVDVKTADARNLPLPDETMNAVISSLAIHNIPNAEGRTQAVREAVRVLKPGGRVVIQDIRNIKSYAAVLASSGMVNVSVSMPQFRIFPPARIVSAEKPA
jgi:ubiquinone/menaquinone biosynthesis C-methylase UbiE